MTHLVVDCSAIIAWFLNEIEPTAMAHLSDLIGRSGAIVPGHFGVEVGNTLLMAERRGRLKKGEAALALADIDGLEFEVDDSAVRRASGPWIDLARKHRLSVYDAVYLDLALRLEAQFATLDRELTVAARKERVALLDLGVV